MTYRGITLLILVILLPLFSFGQKSICVSGNISENGSKTFVNNHAVFLALAPSLSGQIPSLSIMSQTNAFGEYNFIIPNIPLTSFPFGARVYTYDGNLVQQYFDLWFSISDTIEAPVKFYITSPDSALAFLDFEQSCDPVNSPTYLTFTNDDMPEFSNLNQFAAWKLNNNPWKSNQSISHFFSSIGINTLQYRLILQDSLSGFVFDTLNVSRQIAFSSSLFHTIGGNVLANAIPIQDGAAVLYRRYGNILEAADTMIIDTLGYFFFQAVPQCQYTVRVAAFIEDPTHMFVPTYLGNTLHWTDADHRLLNQDIYNANISLVEGQNVTTGSASITALLSPAPNFPIPLLLLDQNHNPATFAVMTTDGYAWFYYVPFGNWYLTMEEYGIPSTETAVTTDANNPNVFVPLSASASCIDYSSNPISIWPNPASDIIWVGGCTDESKWLITDISGRQLMNGFAGNDEFSIALHDLPSGYYLIILQSNNNTQTIPFSHF